MTYASLARDNRTYCAAGIIALATALIVGGAAGLAGMAIGLAGALFGVAALWQLIKLLGVVATSGGSPKFGTMLTIIAFLAKVPLYIVLYSLATRIGHAAPNCFLGGVLLVYFGLVVWASAR